MTKSEIVQSIAKIHNNLARIMVSGDGAIHMGNALQDMRTLVQIIQRDAENDDRAQQAANEGTCERKEEGRGEST